MPLNVAQLTIGVNADVTQAQEAIQGLNQSITQDGSQSQATGTEMSAAFTQVIQAIANLNAAVQGTAANMVESLKPVEQELTEVASAANSTGSTMGGMGAVGAGAIGNINMAMVASGQQIGPLNTGMMLMANSLRQVNTDGSGAATALYAGAAAATALGIASAAAAAPLHQAQEGLKNSIEQTGASVDSYSGQLDKATTNAERLGRTQTDLDKGLTTLTTGFGDVDKALSNLTLTEDVAARRHTSLEEAGKTIIRVYEGYGRTLKELGIDMVFTHNAQAGLDDANKALTNSTTALDNATAKYDEAVQKDADIHTEAALARDKVAQASQSLSDANANLAYTEQRIQIENQATAEQLDETAKATQALDQATANLAYTQDKLAAQAEIPITNHAEEALRRVQDAELQLEDSQARLSASTTITQVDQDQLAASTDRVVEAQQKMAEATGGNILGAQSALRSAIQQQREELDRLHAKSIESVQDKNAQTKAALDLQRAQEDYVKAQQTDKGDADLKAIENAHTLQDAEDAVNKARAAVPLAVQKDYANAQLKQLEQANQLRTANNQVRDAQEGLAQAYRDNAAEALKLRDADFGVADAKRALDTAAQKHQEALDKVTEATKKLADEQTQGQRALDLLAAKVKGAAESQAKGWVGSINEIKAKITDWLGHFGNASGKFLTFALPLMIMFKGLSGSLFGGAGAATAVEGSGGLLAGLGAVATAAAPVLAVVAAVVAVGVAFYEAYTHIKSFHDAVDEVGSYIASVFTPIWHAVLNALKPVQGIWKDMTKDVMSLVNDGIKFFREELAKVNKFLADHRQELHEVGKVLEDVAKVIRASVVFVITNLLVPAIHGLETAWRIAWNFIYTSVKITWDMIMGAIKVATDVIIGVISFFLDFFTGHWDKALKDLDNMVSSIFHDIVDTISSILGDFVHGIAKLAKDIIEGLWQGLVDAFHALFDFGKLLYDNIVKPVLDFFGISSPSRKMQGFGSDIIEGLWNGLRDAFGTFMNFEQLLHDHIVVPIENFVTNVYNAGVNIVQGLIDGIGSGASALGKTAENLLNTVTDGLSGFLFGSPSKLMHERGRWIAEGLAEGIKASTPAVVTSMSGMTDMVNRAMKDMASGNTATSLRFGAINVSPGSAQALAAAGGGRPVVVQQFNRELLRVDGNLIHERDLPQYLKDLIIPVAKRQGGNFFGGFG